MQGYGMHVIQTVISLPAKEEGYFYSIHWIQKYFDLAADRVSIKIGMGASLANVFSITD